MSRFNRTAIKLAAIPLVMLGASFAAVPAYNFFCKVTGFSGTTQVGDVADLPAVSDETIVVRFAATTMADMPWEFHAVEPKVEVHLGETRLVFFEAFNPTDQPITGTASYNVAPFESGGYFSKIECFCFTEQTLQPGERIEMPVTFYVDPDIKNDPDTKGFESLTLAYTFHLTEPDETVKVETKPIVSPADDETNTNGES